MRVIKVSPVVVACMQSGKRKREENGATSNANTRESLPRWALENIATNARLEKLTFASRDVAAVAQFSSRWSAHQEHRLGGPTVHLKCVVMTQYH